MIAPIKGTHDFLDLTVYNFIIDQARIHLHNACFTEIATPLIEPIDLFKRTLGTHTDVISKEMFTIQPHPNSSEQICLRPEATASTTRAFLQHAIQEQPWKVFSHGPMFRYERPQKGRFRQFHQLNIEIIHTPSTMHDIQLIALLDRFLRDRMGLTNYSLFINCLGCPSDRATYRDILKNFLSQNAAAICDTCSVRADTNSMRIFDCKNSICQEIYNAAPFIADHVCASCAQDWHMLQQQLTVLNIAHTYNPKLVRGLDYYNQTVFEFSSDDLGAQNAFCGGGRYELAQQCGAKKPVPSIGAAIGLERLMLLLEAKKEPLALPVKPASHMIMPLTEKQQLLALMYADQLHVHNLCVEVAFDGASVKNMMRKANKVGATYALLIGDDEQQQHTVTIKNMITGEQKVIASSELIAYLKSKP
ncbi:MAG: histidine--tRNA ligase [Candidatus Dependentiae bacterium]|nr:histidine--tRNA ligase [Candidatus Dependentiae bacterium]